MFPHERRSQDIIRDDGRIGSEIGIFNTFRLKKRRFETFLQIVMVLGLFSLVTLLVLLHTIATLATASRPLEVGGTNHISLFAPLPVIEEWGQYAPAYSVQRYENPPRECKITQVNILSRHGARFPTAKAGQAIMSAVKKLKSASHYTQKNLQFLKDYEYDLGSDVLVPFGALQARIAGQVAFSRYHSLVDRVNIPFVRSSGSERVIDSANNWTVGFSEASGHRFNPVLSIILSEDPTANNTLDDSGCPNAGDSDAQVNTWVDMYAAPIANKLNKQAMGMTENLTTADVQNLISLCPFESVFKQRLSNFCDIFRPEDFAAFEWSTKLNKFYGTGYGQSIGGRVQGVGYVNELLARLTNTSVQDSTQTNRTLTSNPETFPLDRTIYADFSHDNQMIAIYAAIGLFNVAPLDPTSMDLHSKWDTSDMVPFSGMMVVERLRCAGREKTGEYVRILVNDAVQQLPFCGGDRDGLCELSRFVESQSYARNNGEGDFELCFASL